MPYRSVISYSITKPYPYPWFAPVGIAGLIVLAVVVSVVNYYSTGFVLTFTSTTDPNSTIGTYTRLGRWPILNSHSQPTCQARSIAVNDQFFTNQTALTYTLAGVWQQNASPITILPALDYYNNPIEDCVINGIAVDVTSLDRSGNQIAYSTWGQVVRTYITCSIQIPSGTVHFNLTQSYDYVPDTISLAQVSTYLGTNFLDRNASSKASLWWGESCMSAYWGLLSGGMQLISEDQNSNDQTAIRKGTLFFTPTSRAVSDISSLNYFNVDFRFVVDHGQGVFDIVWPAEYLDGSNGPLPVSVLDSIGAYPNIWVFADGLVKATYSTILTDLGQVSGSSNILTNATTLQEFTTTIGTSAFRANTMPGPANASYNELKAFTGPLEVTPSVIRGIYLCSVPQRKPAGTLLISILVADIVFLQAFWFLYLFVIERLFLRKRPYAHFCQGCEPQNAAGGDDERLRDRRFRGGERIGKSNAIRLRNFSTNSEHSDNKHLLQVPNETFNNGAYSVIEQGRP